MLAMVVVVLDHVEVGWKVVLVVENGRAVVVGVVGWKVVIVGDESVTSNDIFRQIISVVSLILYLGCPLEFQDTDDNNVQMKLLHL